jgi:hypothetical protein
LLEKWRREIGRLLRLNGCTSPWFTIPVIDKNGETIASAVTNLDLHDIARVCQNVWGQRLLCHYPA